MLQKKKTKISKTIIFFLIIIVALILLGVFLRNFWFKTIGISETVLFQKGWNLKTYFWGLTHLKELVYQNQELKSKNLELLQNLQKMEALRQENYLLKESLQIKTPGDFSFTIVRPITLDQSNNILYLSSPPNFTLIKKGTPILTHTKQVVGIVEEVSPGYISVKLITAPNFKMIAKTEKNQEVIIKGGGNFQLTLENFPKDKKIEKGEKIITSMDSKNFPPDFLIGQVVEVQANDVDPFQKIKITPYFSSTLSAPFLAILNWQYPIQ